MLLVMKLWVRERGPRHFWKVANQHPMNLPMTCFLKFHVRLLVAIGRLCTRPVCMIMKACI